MTQGQQDAVESQVGEGLKKCHDSIQRLQSLIVPTGVGMMPSTANHTTVAHRQGVVGSSNTLLQPCTYHSACQWLHAAKKYSSCDLI